MSKRTIAVVLGAAALAVPGTAVAGNGHGKGGKDVASEKAAKHESKSKKGKKGKQDKAAKARKPVKFVFKGVYAGEGVVTVKSGNAHARKGGFVGQDVSFDLSSAKIVAADSDGVPGVTADDLQVGDELLVQARLPRGTKAAAGEGDEAAELAAAIVARKVVDKTHPPVEEAEEAEAAPVE